MVMAVFWFEKPEHGVFEEGFPLFRNIGEINRVVLERVNFPPIRPQLLWGSRLVHDDWSGL
jgi:hypothetical protein